MYGLLLILILDLKKFIYSFKHQIIHLYFYSKNFSKSFLIKKLSKYLTLNDIFHFIKRPNIISFKKIILKEPIRSFIFLPEFFICFILLFNNTHDTFLSKDAIFVLSVLTIYLLTTTKKFSFIGESYRYLEYCFYILGPLILIKNLSENNKNILSLIIIFNILLILTYYLISKKSKPSKFKSDFRVMISNYPFNRESKVLTIPLRIIHGLILNTEASGIWWQPESINKYVVNEIIEQYPFPKKDLDIFIRKYDVNTIVFEKKYHNNLPWSYDFSGIYKVFENESFIVFTTKR